MATIDCPGSSLTKFQARRLMTLFTFCLSLFLSSASCAASNDDISEWQDLFMAYEDVYPWLFNLGSAEEAPNLPSGPSSLYFSVMSEKVEEHWERPEPVKPKPKDAVSGGEDEWRGGHWGEETSITCPAQYPDKEDEKVAMWMSENRLIVTEKNTDENLVDFEEKPDVDGSGEHVSSMHTSQSMLFRSSSEADEDDEEDDDINDKDYCDDADGLGDSPNPYLYEGLSEPDGKKDRARLCRKGRSRASGRSVKAEKSSPKPGTKPKMVGSRRSATPYSRRNKNRTIGPIYTLAGFLKNDCHFSIPLSDPHLLLKTLFVVRYLLKQLADKKIVFDPNTFGCPPGPEFNKNLELGITDYRVPLKGFKELFSGTKFYCEAKTDFYSSFCPELKTILVRQKSHFDNETLSGIRSALEFWSKEYAAKVEAHRKRKRDEKLKSRHRKF